MWSVSPAAPDAIGKATARVRKRKEYRISNPPLPLAMAGHGKEYRILKFGCWFMVIGIFGSIHRIALHSLFPILS
jgi:hypothetical protein